jgi:hypothetical protein
MNCSEVYEWGKLVGQMQATGIACMAFTIFWMLVWKGGSE